MPETIVAVSVSGTVAADSDGAMLVLSERLDGYDTFLTGQLELDESNTVTVRILTLDDLTVLRFTEKTVLPPHTVAWAGILHLPHGWRTHMVPDDLQSAASHNGRDLTVLDAAELRYALTFLGEAATREIRHARVAAIVSALPACGWTPK